MKIEDFEAMKQGTLLHSKNGKSGGFVCTYGNIIVVDFNEEFEPWYANHIASIGESASEIKETVSDFERKVGAVACAILLGKKVGDNDARKKLYEEVDKIVMERFIGKAFTYKGEMYKVVGFTSYKHPENREWIRSVVYKRIEETMVTTWVRDTDEFFGKFEIVSP